jgi:protein N-terminal glutamine amidohydrolase
MNDRRVVFISNAARRVAVRRQAAGRGGPVVWDYHVVLIGGGKVWDPDTTLGFPVDFDLWVQESFFPLVPGLEPRFRVIDAATYRSKFASDRSHMMDRKGKPLKPAPDWPKIGEGMNLMSFVDLAAPFVGEVADLESLARLTAPRPGA